MHLRFSDEVLSQIERSLLGIIFIGSNEDDIMRSLDKKELAYTSGGFMSNSSSWSDEEE